MFRFDITAKIKGKRGRAGVIHTAHGDIATPAFIPVGTKATVKALSPEQVRDDVKADAVLANTYHLYLQPGTEILEKAGGLHKFMNWSGPTFTDSGGFQAFSLGAAFNGKGSKINKRGGELQGEGRTKNEERKMQDVDDQTRSSFFFLPSSVDSKMAKVTEDGVEFKSIIDGSTHFFTPERSMEIQKSIGADIIFAFDECTSSLASEAYQKEAMDRTHRWAVRSLIRHKELETQKKNEELSMKYEASEKNSSFFIPHSQSLFGIVQGGRYEHLRKESAKIIGSMDFDGFGIGGSFDKEDISTAVGWVVDELPEGKPRHLLGIGEPEDLILGIENGIDTFDCVSPTRMARNGAAYSSEGRINILNARFGTDMGKLDPVCECYTCTNYSRAYISHLFRAKEMFAATLMSIHNLYFLVDLAKRARQAIVEGRWEEFKESTYKSSY